MWIWRTYQVQPNHASVVQDALGRCYLCWQEHSSNLTGSWNATASHHSEWAWLSADVSYGQVRLPAYRTQRSQVSEGFSDRRYRQSGSTQWEEDGNVCGTCCSTYNRIIQYHHQTR